MCYAFWNEIEGETADKKPLYSGETSGENRQNEGDGDAVSVWVTKNLGFQPDVLQARILDTQARCGILNCTRQWGKSTVTAAMAVHQAWREKGSLTVVVNPTSRQSGEFVRKATEFARRLDIKPKGDGDNEISLAFPNGSRIVGLPGTEATVRGYSAVALLLADEASRVSDELYMAVRPMLAVSAGKLWLMSTPYGKRGFFWETWERGGPEWERIRATAAECPRIAPEFLQREKRAMTERWYRQEGGTRPSLAGGPARRRRRRRSAAR